MTCLAHLPPSSFALHLTPTSHCASLTCPSKVSLSGLRTTLTIGKHLFRLLPESLVNPSLQFLGSTCLLPVALKSSHCHLVSTSLPAVGTALMPAVGAALSSRVLWVPSLAVSSLILHVSPIRVLPLTSWLTDALSPFLCRLLLLCCADSWFRHHACHPRSFASSRLTATFCSSSSSDASLSCNFVRDFSSGLLLQLHLVVVYSDVAAGGHSSTAVQYSATA